MYNLLDSIASSAAQRENISSDVLAYLLNGIPEFQAKFLELLHPAKPIAPSAFCREYDLDSKGRVDFQFDNGTTVLYMENKPWSYSSVGNQLSAYAEALKNEPAEQKILCLLATDENQAALLNETAVNANVTVAELDKLFSPIQFETITWKAVLECLSTSQPENKALQLWYLALRDFIGLSVVLTPEDLESWTKNFACAHYVKSFSTKQFLAQNYNSYTGTSKNAANTAYGWYIIDTINNIAHWVGIDRTANSQATDKQIYITKTSIQWKFDNINNPTVITTNILNSCGYKPHKEDRGVYYKPLFEPDEEVHANNLTNKIITTLNTIRDAIVR